MNKEEREIADNEEYLRFIGKKYMYVWENQFFDNYFEIKKYVIEQKLLQGLNDHDLRVQLIKTRLVIERDCYYEPAIFSLDTKTIQYDKIVEGNITDYVVKRYKNNK
jgi:hypothetical protein